MLRLLLPVALLVAGIQSGHATGEAFSDLILFNGRILTVDARDSIASAVAIRAGRITLVGDDEQVKATAGPGTQQIDLQGQTATPGLIEMNTFRDWNVYLK